jgi:aromatic ring-opening dioxygenase catalytic subunit (LigB family)
MRETKLCCTELESMVHAVREKGIGVMYLASGHGTHRFYLQMMEKGGATSKEIKFCPWCGNELSTISMI